MMFPPTFGMKGPQRNLIPAGFRGNKLFTAPSCLYISQCFDHHCGNRSLTHLKWANLGAWQASQGGGVSIEQLPCYLLNPLQYNCAPAWPVSL